MLKNTDELKYEKAVLNKDDSNNLEKASYIPNGVSEDIYNQYNTKYSASENLTNKDKESSSAANNYKNVANGQMISSTTQKNLNAQFNVPSAVAEADAWLSNQLQKIQSGRTSYTDDVQNTMDKILNREKFSYDVDTDPLFQQALASAMNSGKQAMQDTIGQASALTGGYGSTYATSVGNQAYNSYVEGAYDDIAQYYQMALNQYQMEGDELYRQLGMFTDADDREYNRNVAAYDATYQHRNQLYNEAYQMHRDGKTDAFNMANLEVNMYGQKVSDAYNYYTITSNEADKQYQREYNEWQDSINQAYQMMGMQNTDWWNQTNFDEGVRQYEQNYAQNEDHFTRGQEFQATESQKQRDWQTSEAEKDRNFTASENAKNRAASKSGSGGNGYELSTGEISAIKKAWNDAGGGQAGWDAVVDTLSMLGKPLQSDEQSAMIKNILGNESISSDNKSGIDWKNANIIKTVDTTNGLFGLGGNWHIDSNDKYEINGNTYYAKDIKEAMEEDGIPEAMINEILKNINTLDKNGTYNYNKFNGR